MEALTYRIEGDYRIPNLTVPEESDETVLLATGRFALKRREYLKNNRKGLFFDLLTTCTLNEHLAEIERTARERMELMVSQMAVEQGVIEQIKESDQMRWVKLMNNIRQAAEEIILHDLIYV